MGEPGDAADHHHREDERAAGEQPHGDRGGAALRVWGAVGAGKAEIGIPG